MRFKDWVALGGVNMDQLIEESCIQPDDWERNFRENRELTIIITISQNMIWGGPGRGGGETGGLSNFNSVFYLFIGFSI